MPRIPKRLIALGGLAAAGTAALRRVRTRRQTSPASSPFPSSTTPAAPPVSTAGPSASPVDAPPPTEAPGPSVTPPGRGAGSDTERAERADATTPDADVLQRRAGGPVDELVEAETSAAAAEAAAIGGPRLDDAHGDPAMEAVYEAGGGEAEGFEAAEDELIENATHGDGRAEPASDAFTPEIESDEVTVLDAEADEEKTSEVVDDAAERQGEAGSGPGITHER
jgi:hypothetical protein